MVLKKEDWVEDGKSSIKGVTDFVRNNWSYGLAQRSCRQQGEGEFVCLRAKHGQWIMCVCVDTETAAGYCYEVQTESGTFGQDEED